jgi:hypothetical protein
MKLTKIIALFAFLGTLSLAVSGCKTSHEMHGSSSVSSSKYPLTKCVVSDEDLGDKPYTFVHNGQTVKLCCADCETTFKKDPAKYMAKVNQAK